MARGNRTVYPDKRNKWLSSTFQPPEGRGVHRPKRCDKHGYKDDDNSPKNVNNVHNTSSQKCVFTIPVYISEMRYYVLFYGCARGVMVII